MKIAKEILLKAYRDMLTIRVFEERVNREMDTGEIPGAVHLYAGQEASAVGVCIHLDETDWIVSTHRGHGHCIAKGCDVFGMMAEIFGRSSGICKGKGGSMHIADMKKGMMGANGIVGGGPPMIAGAALTSKLKKTNGVGVAFAGDGAFNQGTTAETMNLAVVWNLPIVFVIEDNGFAEATSSDYATAGIIVDRAKAFGISSELVDGLDFFKIYDFAAKAINRSRNESSPSLLHIKTKRYFGHFSGDTDSYRSIEEKQKMRRDEDCIKIFREKIILDDLINENELEKIDNEVHLLVEDAVKKSKESKFPSPDELLTDVYSEY